jgi:indolepyruvate ferredoxin oxidoreductase alpha subunit
MSDMPVLEPASVAEAYELVQTAFDLSEEVGTPVFVRLVTAIANSQASIDVEEPGLPPEREPQLVRDINIYTKAGSVICTTQHRDLIRRLDAAGERIEALDLNRLEPASEPGGVGVVVSGAVRAYLEEGLEIAAEHGLEREALSFLHLAAPHPLPVAKVRALLEQCSTVLVLEELEPHVERGLYVEAQRMGWQGRIVGKIEGPLERVGEYGVGDVVRGLAEAATLSVPESLLLSVSDAESLAAARPITCCAGCPHRGTYMAINAALRKLKYKKDEVMVTGDIGCTILGMNPPFYTVWNEISMGASVSLAQGFVHSGVETPVIATIGDSTFFHGGMPGLVNAIQHDVEITLIVMDNAWTSMTGMQVNPGTPEPFQPDQSGVRSVDLAKLIPAMGVEHFFIMDPFEHEMATEIVRKALTLPGVKVILSRQECAIQAQRRDEQLAEVSVDPEKCIFCKKCITVTGCPALALGDGFTVIDESLCYGCGLCAEVCPVDAIEVVR